MRNYVGADFHRDITMLKQLCREKNTTKDDILWHAGDFQLNYLGYLRDRELKRRVATLPITVVNVMGNHEMKPETIPYYELADWMGGKVYKDPEFDNILFAKDGEVYDINGLKVMAIGGAYSPNKHDLVAHGYFWEPREQLTDEEKAFVEAQLTTHNKTIDMVISHTAPKSHIPKEAYLPGFKDHRIDDSIELWLKSIEENLDYKHWYCGHFHIDADIGKLHFLYKRILEF